MLKKKGFPISILLISAILTINLFIPRELEATIYGSISGKVIGEDTGEGVKGVKVELYYWKGDAAYKNTITDKYGNFYFDMIHEGKFYLLFLPPPPYIKETIQFENTVTLKKGQNITNYVKNLKVGGSISGTIHKGDGITPLEGVSIIVFAEGGTRGATKSSPDGKYIMNQLKPMDNYIIEIHPKGYALQRIKGIKIEAYKETSEVDFIVDLEDITGIEGTVISATDGEPLRNIGIAIFNINEELKGETVTDENGKYSISNLEPGIYEVVVYPPGLKLFDDDIAKGNILVRKGEKTQVNFNINLSSGTFQSNSNKLIFFLIHY